MYMSGVALMCLVKYDLQAEKRGMTMGASDAIFLSSARVA